MIILGIYALRINRKSTKLPENSQTETVTNQRGKKVNLSTNKCNINAKLSNKSANIMKLIKSDLPTLTRTKTYH